MNLLWPMDPPPQYQSRDAMNNSTEHIDRGILLWAMNPPVPEQRWLAYCSSIHHFWDTPQHFLKTCFSLECGFLVFLDLQKSLPVSFQGCWTQWQRFESSHICCFWDTQQHFLKTHFLLRKWLSFISRAPEIHPVLEQRCLAYQHTQHGSLNLLWQMDPPVPRQRCLEHSSIHHFWDTPQHFLKTHFSLESGFLSFLELQKSPQYQSRDALNTSTHNMADEPTLADGPPPPSTRAEMPGIPVHKKWQMNPIFSQWTPSTRQRCLEYHYTKLGRWTLL